MSQILAALLIVTATVVFILGRLGPAAITASQLGCVSEQWLAEYRASHPI